jgi:predicted PurR-regulated permease PerM
VVGVPPLLVILGLIVGAELAGFLGIILSVPVAATLQEFIHDLEAGKLPKAQ